ncbi:MAG: TetR/AcrR family transcriptional regulator [Actinomycetia bacterium]|nr:TetR/AcrR family transcriptional regulator [Actinomycetes bacterium]
MSPTVPMDRPAAIRRAVRELVAEQGFHGTSMSAVAEVAGVATGTAYVYYDSKEALVCAAYAEAKHQMGSAVAAVVDPDVPPHERFGQMWRAAYDYMVANPGQARYLMQVDVSPYADSARAMVTEGNDPMMLEAENPDVAELLVSIPIDVVYSLSLGQAIRLAASGIEMTDDEIGLVVEACWRAITRP